MFYACCKLKTQHTGTNVYVGAHEGFAVKNVNFFRQTVL